MEFNTPTTKEAMYTTLRSIYNYYRIQRDGYTPTTFTPLSLNRIAFTPLTDVELLSKAETLTLAKNEERKAKKKESLEKEIAAANAKISALNSAETTLTAAINSRYAASEDKLRSEASKKGFANSSVLLSEIAALESKKNAEITALGTEYAAKRADCTASISAAGSAITGLSTYCADLYTAEKNAEFTKLKDEQRETVVSVNKYNGLQDEKEQKQAISVALSNADLQLKFLALQTSSFTKEQLVEMGYYTDVVNCITGYFGTLSSAAERYTSFASESQLVFYLEDYYPDILYMYRTLAGL